MIAPAVLAIPRGAAHSCRGGMNKMENNGREDIGFVQPEKEYFEKLFSRRANAGRLPHQTEDEYAEEMRGIEAALRECGVAV